MSSNDHRTGPVDGDVGASPGRPSRPPSSSRTASLNRPSSKRPRAADTQPLAIVEDVPIEPVGAASSDAAPRDAAVKRRPAKSRGHDGDQATQTARTKNGSSNGSANGSANGAANGSANGSSAVIDPGLIRSDPAQTAVPAGAASSENGASENGSVTVAAALDTSVDAALDLESSRAAADVRESVTDSPTDIVTEKGTDESATHPAVDAAGGSTVDPSTPATPRLRPLVTGLLRRVTESLTPKPVAGVPVDVGASMSAAPSLTTTTAPDPVSGLVAPTRPVPLAPDFPLPTRSSPARVQPPRADGLVVARSLPNYVDFEPQQRRAVADDLDDLDDTGPLDGPRAGPSAATIPTVKRPVRSTATTGRRRPRIRRVTRVVRHVDPWSVFKVALCFSVVLYGVCLTAGVLLWNVAYTTGTIDNMERFFESFGWDTFEFKGGELFHNAWIGGLFVAVGLTGFIVLSATLFNLITDLVGGVRVTVLEEEVVERDPALRRSILGGRRAGPGPASVRPDQVDVEDPFDDGFNAADAAVVLRGAGLPAPRIEPTRHLGQRSG